MLIITLETGGQDSSSSPQAFNYQPLTTQLCILGFSLSSPSLTLHALAEYLPLICQARTWNLSAFVASESLASCESIAVQEK